MKPIRLTLRARARLEEIAGWTLDEFGPAQARKYEKQLLARLKALAAGRPPHGRPCALLVRSRTDAADLKYLRESGHYIVYRDRPDAVIIIDFIHGARNLENILAALARDKGAR